MSTIKVDTIATRTGSGNITLSNSLASATVAGDLAVDTNVLKVDSTNNRVGIGTASPGRKLELNNGGTGAFVTFTDGVATNFTFKTDGSNVGTFGTEAGSTHLGLMASGTERARIHSGGIMSVSNGIELGSGLDATAANVLDDYEEGTFTPVLYFGGGTTGITYTSGRQLGQYTKIGDSVFIYIHIQLTSKGSSAGAAQIHGLPFTVKSGGHHYIPAKVWIASMASLNETPTFRFMTGDTKMDCYQMSSNTYSTITQNNCTNSTAFQIAGHYFV